MSWLIRLISFTPFGHEARISARTEAGGRLRCRPRICGMTQKLHGMIAAFGDFQINAVRRGETKTRRVPIGNVGRAAMTVTRVGVLDSEPASNNALDDRAQFAHLIEPDESIHFRQLLRAVRAAKRCDMQPLTISFWFGRFLQPAFLMRLQNRLDRFFLGRIDEGAGVDDQDIRFVSVGGDLHPSLQNAPEHDLGIDQILGAAEADHPDFR